MAIPRGLKPTLRIVSAATRSGVRGGGRRGRRTRVRLLAVLPFDRQDQRRRADNGQSGRGDSERAPAPSGGDLARRRERARAVEQAERRGAGTGRRRAARDGSLRPCRRATGGGPRCASEVARRRLAVLGLLGQCALHDVVQRGRHTRP